ncbi:hypothetical protein ACVJBD_003375 [Rhizobium mongolense]
MPRIRPTRPPNGYVHDYRMSRQRDENAAISKALEGDILTSALRPEQWVAMLPVMGMLAGFGGVPSTRSVKRTGNRKGTGRKKRGAKSTD